MADAGEGGSFPRIPIPKKRRYAQTRAGRTAVKILCPEFFGLTNYKAFTRFDRWSLSAIKISQ
jgi:hypothetical protein